MRWLIIILFGTALLRAANSATPSAAFSWNATSVAIVASQLPGQTPQNSADMPQPITRPPFGKMYPLPRLSPRNGFKIGDRLDINLTANFWVSAVVTGFAHNKTEYADWLLALATINPADQERYAAAIRANLHVFLAEPATPQRVSDKGQIRNPVRKIVLPESEIAALTANVNQIMSAKLQHAKSSAKQQFPADLLLPLTGRKAKLTLDVNQVDLGQPLGVRQHVLATWTIGGSPVFSVQGWKRPDIGRIEFLEAINGLPENKAQTIGTIGDWAEASRDDFEIENVFSSGRLVRHSAGYESSVIYLEQMTATGREFLRSLYEA